MLETGGFGNLQVDKKFYGKGVGEATYITQVLKVSKDLGREATGHILHQNLLSFKITIKLGALWIDNNSFIGVRKKEKMLSFPMWSRL